MRCSWRGIVVVAVVLATTTAGCGGDDSGTGSAADGSTPATTAPVTSTSTAASSTPTAAVPVTSPSTDDGSTSTAVGADCPNPEGGPRNTCLGDITAGVHQTTTFDPHLTYEVPEGWSNMEDLPGNFLLLPPGSTLAGVNPETSDFLGVYSSVGAPVQCDVDEAVDRSVASTPQAMVDWLHTQPAIQVSTANEVTIGGLSGLQVDISLDDANVDAACHDDLGSFALAFVGTGQSSLLHGVSPDYALRLAFLTSGDEVLAIELADAPNGGSDLADWWNGAAEVVDSLNFS
jgi:hypothetical protein